MSKLFAKFTKSPNSQATLSPQSAHGDSPLRTGSIDSPRAFPPSPSPLRTSAQPTVVLTSETSDAATTPTSPGSLHRQSSLGTSLEDIPRKNSLSAAQRQAFADQISRNSGVVVSDDLETPRAAFPPSPVPPQDRNSTPKANGLRPSPSSEFKSPGHVLLPAANLQDSPSVRKQTSAASLTAPPPASRSRRGSVASSDAGSTNGRNINTQMASNAPGLTLVESPTSDRYASPRTSNEGARSPTRSTKSKPSKSRTWRTRGGSGSAGGIAGALAQSGMSLAHPINPGLTAAAVPPVPTKQPTRASTTATAIPRMPSDNSISYGGGGMLSKTTSRGSRSRGHESSDSESYDSEDALSFGPDEIPITGFAVASSKRNMDFHEVFPNVPESDYLIEDYGCALQREILIQGRLYISEHHMCFNANIFGWITNFIVPFSDVTGLEKKMTAFVIPNAIQICTHSAKYTFASFLSRDTTYDVIHNIWRLSNPRPPGELGSSLDLPSTGGGPDAGATKVGGSKHRPTQCACGKEGKHYDTGVIDTVVPGTPEKIYNLMFASGFVKEFMAGEQKLMDIQISDWHPEQSGSQLLARNMSYIKPLNGSIGPKSTKCEIKDETLHVDFDDYVSTLTTTRTPEVPSGGVFSVKTRTCIMWAGPASSRIVVTTTVEWTGRSFIKSIIDKSAIDGQKQYHGDLEKSMRSYIAAHRTEFIPDDADADGEGDDPLAVGDTTISPENKTADSAQSKADRARATELRGLQWLLDTFTGVSNVAKDSFWSAVDLIGDLMADVPGTALLGVVVAVLVISNVWTMFSLREARARASLGDKQGVIIRERRDVTGAGGSDASEAVKVLLEEVLRGRNERERDVVFKAQTDPRAEADALKRSVEALEARVASLKKSLAELD